jgi:hypothetical protein
MVHKNLVVRMQGNVLVYKICKILSNLPAKCNDKGLLSIMVNFYTVFTVVNLIFIQCILL